MKFIVTRPEEPKAGKFLRVYHTRAEVQHRRSLVEITPLTPQKSYCVNLGAIPTRTYTFYGRFVPTFDVKSMVFHDDSIASHFPFKRQFERFNRFCVTTYVTNLTIRMICAGCLLAGSYSTKHAGISFRSPGSFLFSCNHVWTVRAFTDFNRY